MRLRRTITGAKCFTVEDIIEEINKNIAAIKTEKNRSKSVTWTAQGPLFDARVQELENFRDIVKIYGRTV